MFTSFDEEKFKQAIKEKDYLCLKVNTISTILNDPTFERGETDQVLKILEERVPDIFEEELKLDYEERLEPGEWDKRYFTKLTYWFQENFAKSRVAYIKKVGKVVHADTAKKYSESEAIKNPKQNPEEFKRPVQKVNRPKKKQENFWITRVIKAGITLVRKLVRFLVH